MSLCADNSGEFCSEVKDPASEYAETERRKTDAFKRYIESYCMDSKDYELRWTSEPYRVEIEYRDTENGDSEYQTYSGILHTLRYVPRSWESENVIYRCDIANNGIPRSPEVFDLRDDDLVSTFMDEEDARGVDVRPLEMPTEALGAARPGDPQRPTDHHATRPERIPLDSILAFIDAHVNGGHI